MKRMRKKHIMRLAMKNDLPMSIIDKKKVGLEMPYSRLLKSELNDLLMEHLGPERLEATGLFSPAPVRSVVDDHMTGKRDNGRPLWGLLNFMTWHEMYIGLS